MSADPVASAYAIRRAAPPDAPGVAAVHAQVWRETYTGLMPEELVVGAPMEKRIAGWLRAIQEGRICFVAAPDDGTVVGWAACGAARESVLGAGEVLAINILAAHHRRGLGRRLMAECARHLLGAGMTSAGLWVLEENAGAHRFYEALGGSVGPSRQDKRGAHVLRERAYLWADVRVLCG